MFKTKQGKKLYKLATKLDKYISKIDISELTKEEIEILIKFNKAIDNLENVFNDLIRPIVKKG